MKITCDRETLMAAVRSLGAIVPSKSPKPILLHARLAATPQETTIEANNLEFAGRRRLSTGFTVDEPGEILLPHARLVQLLSVSTDDCITFASMGIGQVEVLGQRSRYRLATERPEDFPAYALEPTESDILHGDMSLTTLRRLVEYTNFATDIDASRYALNGSLVEVSAKTITLVATDGRRLARSIGPIENGVATAPDVTHVVPNRGWEALRHLTGGAEEGAQARIFLSGSRILITTDIASLAIRLVEGRFPKYTEVIPRRDSESLRMAVPASELLRSTRQASLVTTEESSGIDWKIGDGKLAMSAGVAEIGESSCDIPISCDPGADAALEVTFTPRYLTEMLRVLPPETNVVCKLIDGKSPGVFEAEDCNFTYVLMPLTRDK